MKPRRLHSATILSMVTTSGMRRHARRHRRVADRPYTQRRCRSTSTAARTGTTFEVMQRMTDDPLTTSRERGARSSACSTPSPSTSRARASTTPTTAPSGAARELEQVGQGRRRQDTTPRRRTRSRDDEVVEAGQGAASEAERSTPSRVVSRRRLSREEARRPAGCAYACADRRGRRRRQAASRRRPARRTRVGGVARRRERREQPAAASAPLMSDWIAFGALPGDPRQADERPRASSSARPSSPRGSSAGAARA